MEQSIAIVVGGNTIQSEYFGVGLNSWFKTHYSEARFINYHDNKCLLKAVKL